LGGAAELMFYSLAQHSFQFFFHQDYPINWITTSSDGSFRIANTLQDEHDCLFRIRNSAQVDYDTTFGIFTLEDIDHDIAFRVQAVALCDIGCVITACAQTDHDTQLEIEEAGRITDHAILFTIRREHEFTN